MPTNPRVIIIADPQCSNCGTDIDFDDLYREWFHILPVGEDAVLCPDQSSKAELLLGQHEE